MRLLSLCSLGLLATVCFAGNGVGDTDPKSSQVPVLVPNTAPAASMVPPQSGQAGSNWETNGVELLAWLTPGDLGTGLLVNDNWGYVSPSGREYAIQCTEESTVFVEVTDPLNPVVVGSIAGPVGIWRDAKVYGEYVYSVHETGGVGIQVIDVSQIDNGVVTLVNTVEGTNTGASHNVVINEESGFLYRTGGGGHGLRIYDLANPANPAYVSTWDVRYFHDAQAVTWSDGRELVFGCGGFNNGYDDTGLTILDASDKQNITVVAQLYHPNAEYSHQGWLSEDRQYFYLGDELDEYYQAINTRTHVYFVGDPDNAAYVGYFENSSFAIGHNMYTEGGKLYQANYRSGLRVFDVASDPLNPDEVAWFDTQPGNDDKDFGGTWSVYPFLPSGVVLLSDREQGLFLLRLDEELGDALCSPADLNSTGQPGLLGAVGSPRVAEGHVTLEASQLPVGETALLLASPGRGGSLGLGGTPGALCVRVPFGRLAAGTTGAGGSLSLPLDLGALPLFGGGTGAAQVGETWVFQMVYGDGGVRRLTEARRVTFQ
jgi:choice-of-anchor B domain-containing protein